MGNQGLSAPLSYFFYCVLSDKPLPSVSPQVNLALKQKSDIEHYRNKLRLKAKRKGYYDFPSTEGNSSSKTPRHGGDKAEHILATRPSSRTPEYDDDRSSTYVKSHRRLVSDNGIILLCILGFNGTGMI